MEVAMAKKSKVPKRIAGVKIPKAIRKGPVGDVLRSSGAQVLLAEVLLALAVVYAARRFDGNATGDELRHPLESLRAGRNWSRAAAERVTRALGAGVQAFRVAMQESLADVGAGSKQAGETASEGAEPTRKKRSARTEEPLETSGSPH
jgi:hypothetical protein